MKTAISIRWAGVALMAIMLPGASAAMGALPKPEPPAIRESAPTAKKQEVTLNAVNRQWRLQSYPKPARIQRLGNLSSQSWESLSGWGRKPPQVETERSSPMLEGVALISWGHSTGH